MLLEENERQLLKILKKSRWKNKATKKLMNKNKEKKKDENQEYMKQLDELYSLQNPLEELADEEHDAEIFKAIYTSVLYHQKTLIQRFFKRFTRHRVKRDEEVVCYKDLGCFRDEGPFDYFDMLPDSPEQINTQFLLHTKENEDREQYIQYQNMTTLLKSNFKASRKTKFIIHGFGSSCHRVWVREMRETILKMEDVNIICVQWADGASTPNYVKAASNTRLVGSQVALLLEKMIKVANLSLEDVHLIGFSLGAHVSGYAGQRQTGIGRITGLDPAGPLFESFPPSMRLDSSDAKFVDVIHTNADSLLWGGLGAYDPMGHVDFYPNGGRVQKGCKNLFVGGVSDILWPKEGDGRYLCNHRRGYKYFMESIIPVCKFPAFHCRDYDMFLKGDCFPCSDCGNMGYYADKAPGRGQLYLLTRDTEPFCANQYKVEIWHSGGPPTTDSVSTQGRFDVTFINHDGKNETIHVTRNTGKKMEAGSKTVTIIVLHIAMSVITSLHVKYSSHRGWISSGFNRWAIDKLSIMSSSGKIQSFCHRGLTMESGLPMAFPLVPGDCNPRELTLHPLPVPWLGADYDYSVQNGAHVFPYEPSTSQSSQSEDEASVRVNITRSSVKPLPVESSSPPDLLTGGGSSTLSVLNTIPSIFHQTSVDFVSNGSHSNDVNDHAPNEDTLSSISDDMFNFGSNISHIMTAEEFAIWRDAPPPNVPGQPLAQKPNSNGQNSEPQKIINNMHPVNIIPAPQLGQGDSNMQNSNNEDHIDSESTDYQLEAGIATKASEIRQHPREGQTFNESKNVRGKEGGTDTNISASSSKDWRLRKESMIREDAQVTDIDGNISTDIAFVNNFHSRHPIHPPNIPNSAVHRATNDYISGLLDNVLKMPIDLESETVPKISEVGEELPYNSVIDGEVPVKERARSIKFDSPNRVNHPTPPRHKGKTSVDAADGEPQRHLVSEKVQSSAVMLEESSGNDFSVSSHKKEAADDSEQQFRVTNYPPNSFPPSSHNDDEHNSQVSYQHYRVNSAPPQHFGAHTLPPTVLKPPRLNLAYHQTTNNGNAFNVPSSLHFYPTHHLGHPVNSRGRHRYYPRPPVGFQAYNTGQMEFSSASSFIPSISSYDHVPTFRSQAPFHFPNYPSPFTTQHPKSTQKPFNPLAFLSFGSKGSSGNSKGLFSFKRDKSQNSESRLPRLFPFLSQRFTSGPKRISLPTNLRAPPQNQQVDSLPTLDRIATRRSDGKGISALENIHNIDSDSNARRSPELTSNFTPKYLPSKPLALPFF